jgi:hypothetical protein
MPTPQGHLGYWPLRGATLTCRHLLLLLLLLLMLIHMLLLLQLLQLL